MFKDILLVAIILPTMASCQVNKGNSKVSYDFQHSIINIECEGRQFSTYEIGQYLAPLYKDSLKRKSADSLWQELESKEVISSGSAIYITENGNEYLVTAKHVIYDSVMTNQVKFNQQNNPQTKNWNPEVPFDRVSIKTPYEAALKGKQMNEALSLSIYDTSIRPYIFSNDAEDIAIISLQSFLTDTLKTLLRDVGYLPLPISKIDSEINISIGDDVYAIGYPAISRIGEFRIDPPGFVRHQLPDIVLPITCFGRIAMIHPTLDFFVADIDAYPGNSGGPIVFENRIVGIVSKQLIVDNVTDLPDPNVRVQVKLSREQYK
jgi:hypothetical protein